jgi:hypothetical protein
VEGPSTPNPRPASLTPRLKGQDGHSALRLFDFSEPKAEKIALVRDEMVMLGLEFTRDDGRKPELKDYLGAPAHFTITNLAGTKLIHAHPMIHGGKLMLHVTFPDAGDYKIFAQFLDLADHGVPSFTDPEAPAGLRTVELSVHVDTDF